MRIVRNKNCDYIYKTSLNETDHQGARGAGDSVDCINERCIVSNPVSENWTIQEYAESIGEIVGMCSYRSFIGFL